jgi:hypothetical protein
MRFVYDGGSNVRVPTLKFLLISKLLNFTFSPHRVITLSCVTNRILEQINHYNFEDIWKPTFTLKTLDCISYTI